ncbi:sulfatase-like hydrolase/transferase [soil metagenome]
MNTKKKGRNYIIISGLLLLTVLNSCKKNFEPTSAETVNTDILSQAVTRPNIVLILGDDIGYEIPTVNGGQSYATPNIDLMARAGMRFTQCYASPLCSPSRFMFLTGKYNFRNYTTWGIMDQSQRTFANMLSDAGYDTYVAGKWQVDGGDQSVRTFGFNQSYTIFEQFEDGTLDHDGDPNTLGRYKNPELYANGASLPPGSTENKYCDDILVDSLVSCASRSASNQKPFFIYYPLSLCHYPYSPTPDDPEFAAWDPRFNFSDTTFFPSMVQYMDKKIGDLFQRMDRLGLSKNTVFIFIGDNGTPQEIVSRYKNQRIQGGKSNSTVWGTHVPLMIYWRGVVRPGSVNSDLVDFTDFLPTLAGIANVPVPSDYGMLDGVSFYPRLKGLAGAPRSWVFCHYDPQTKNPPPLKRWMQDITYKLYDITGNFYNTVIDSYEKTKLKDSQLTPDEKAIKANFQSLMATLHN